MNSLELKDKEIELRERASAIIDGAKVEGRKLNDSEEKEFSDIKTSLKEVLENRSALDSKLKQLDNEIKIENRSKEIKVKTNMDKETKNFRLLDTISSIVNNRAIDDVNLEVIKRGLEQMSASGQSYSGLILIPVSTRALNGVILATLAYTANTYNGGKEAVPTDTFDIVTGLYGNLTLSNAGSTIMTGLIGNVEIPTYTGTNVGWNTEIGDAINGTGTFGSVKMSPKRLSCFVDVSKQFLIQTSDTAEALLRLDIINSLSAEIEKSLLTLTLVTNAPAPLATTETSVTTAADWYSLIAGLENANFYGDFNVILSPSLKASLRNIVVNANSGRSLYEDGELDGYPTYTSSNVANGKGFVGVFPELILGLWGAIDIVVDPYTVAPAGKVRIIVNAYFDAVLRRAGAIKAFKYVAPLA